SCGALPAARARGWTHQVSALPHGASRRRSDRLVQHAAAAALLLGRRGGDRALRGIRPVRPRQVVPVRRRMAWRLDGAGDVDHHVRLSDPRVPRHHGRVCWAYLRAVEEPAAVPDPRPDRRERLPCPPCAVRLSSTRSPPTTMPGWGIRSNASPAVAPTRSCTGALPGCSVTCRPPGGCSTSGAAPAAFCARCGARTRRSSWWGATWRRACSRKRRAGG